MKMQTVLVLEMLEVSFAQRLRHQAGLQSHLGIAHLPFDFRLGRQSRHGVDDDDVDGARADQRVGDFERLFAVVRLRNQQVIDIHAELLGVGACRKRVPRR